VRGRELRKAAAKVRVQVTCLLVIRFSEGGRLGFARLMNIMSTAYPPGTAPIKPQSVSPSRFWFSWCSQTCSTEDTLSRYETRLSQTMTLLKGARVTSLMVDRLEPTTTLREKSPA